MLSETKFFVDYFISVGDVMSNQTDIQEAGLRI